MALKFNIRFVLQQFKILIAPKDFRFLSKFLIKIKVMSYVSFQLHMVSNYNTDNNHFLFMQIRILGFKGYLKIAIEETLH